jgi:nucleoside-diphosphate-sugar epimerase
MPEKSVVTIFMRCAMEGRPMQVRDGGIPSYELVYVRDVSGLIVAALERGECGVYNAGSGVSTSVLELAETVRDTFPERRIDVVVAPSEGDIPASFAPLSMSRTKAIWGCEPTPLCAGLREFRRYLEQLQNADRHI